MVLPHQETTAPRAAKAMLWLPPLQMPHVHHYTYRKSRHSTLPSVRLRTAGPKYRVLTPRAVCDRNAVQLLHRRMVPPFEACVAHLLNDPAVRLLRGAVHDVDGAGVGGPHGRARHAAHGIEHEYHLRRAQRSESCATAGPSPGYWWNPAQQRLSGCCSSINIADQQDFGRVR